MSSGRPRVVRLEAAGRLGLGALLVARPQWALGVVGQTVAPPALVAITRVLGARTALQNAVVLAAPTRGVVRGGAAVDALHALSMLAAAAHWPAYRRAALASGAAAGAAAVLALRSTPAT